jgi:hypothetical protein
MKKYAFAHDMPGEHAKWTLTPWRKRGLQFFDRVSDIPDDYILICSHFAPWWSPLREYIAEGRPWIEIEYGYWGPDTPRRETRRVTYCGHHNMHTGPVPYSRAELFPVPEHRPWRTSPGDYIIGIQPVEEILLQRTGENLEQFRVRLSEIVKPYWSGPIHWRKKRGGAKPDRFSSFVEELQRAHAVIGERTMACVESCLLGVPGYTVDASVSTLLMGNIENLGKIQYPDRTTWWEHICWSQFNRAEFDTSAPADLVEQYQIASH